MAEPGPRRIDDPGDARAVAAPTDHHGVASATPHRENTGPADGACMTVWYDGACPLCRREIALYRDLPASVSLRFEDVSDAATALPEGISRSRLLSRFHVRQPDGRLLGGAQAFLAMWAVLPGWRWLARLGQAPGVAWMMEQAYRGFLRLRPALQRGALRWERSRSDGSAGP